MISTFDAFWARYPAVGSPPARRGKAEAEKKWAKVPPALVPKVMDALDALLAGEWKDKDPQFIPHASTWLNQKRWQDEAAVVTPNNQLIEGARPNFSTPAWRDFEKPTAEETAEWLPKLKEARERMMARMDDRSRRMISRKIATMNR